MTQTATTIPIRGYGGEPVPHSFLRQDGPTNHLSLVLPGLNYSCDLPLLYYSTRLLLDSGADVLRVEYAYGEREGGRTPPASERENRLFTDVTAAFEAAIAQRAYARITLVGKSLGTLAMAHLVGTQARLAPAAAIWLTPILNNPAALTGITRWGGRSLFAIGTADPFYDAARLAEVTTATSGEGVVIDGADHGLEIPGDVLRSLDALMQIMQAVHRFVS